MPMQVQAAACYILVLKFVPPQVGCVAQSRTQLVGRQATLAALRKFGVQAAFGRCRVGINAHSTLAFFGNIRAAFMPMQVQAASRKERVRAYRTHPTPWF